MKNIQQNAFVLFKITRDSTYRTFIYFQSDHASAITHSRADTRNQYVQKPRIRRSDELGVTRFGRFI